MTATATDLRQVPLFQGMTDRALEAIAALAHEVEVDAGQPLTTEGDDGDAFFLLLDGQIEITRGGGTVGQLGPGTSSARSRSSTAAPGRRLRRPSGRCARWRCAARSSSS